MDPDVYTPDINCVQASTTDKVPDLPPIPNFTADLYIQTNPFFRLIALEDFSSSKDKSTADPDPDVQFSMTEKYIRSLQGALAAPYLQVLVARVLQ